MNKIEVFLTQVLNGEPLAIIKLCLYILAAYLVYNLWRKIYWRGRPFFRVTFYILGGLLVYGIFFCPDLVAEKFNNLTEWVDQTWLQNDELQEYFTGGS